MCEECFKLICPGSCPETEDYSAELGAPLLYCSVCDSPLYSGDRYICTDNDIYCSECIEELDTDDILNLCSAESISALLEELGFKLKQI